LAGIGPSTDYKNFFQHFSPIATNWFQGSALEPTELQALPAEPTSIRSRASLRCEAEPREQCIPQDDVAVVGLDPIDVIAAELPRRQRRLVEAWAELHQTELLEGWERLQRGEAPLPIAPLE